MVGGHKGNEALRIAADGHYNLLHFGVVGGVQLSRKFGVGGMPSS